MRRSTSPPKNARDRIAALQPCGNSLSSVKWRKSLSSSNHISAVRSSCPRSPERPVANAASAARFWKSPNLRNRPAIYANIVRTQVPAAAGSTRQDLRFAAITSACGKATGSMSSRLRPDRVGTILMEDPDSDEYRAVCDPAKPVCLADAARLQTSCRDGEKRADRCRQGGIEILAHSRQWAMGSLHLNRCKTCFRVKSIEEISKLTLPPGKFLV